MEYLDVSCAVIIEGGSVLATQRSSDMPHSGKWEFPGGKLNEGEAAEESIVREISEEMCVKVRALRQLEPVIHCYPDRTVRLIPLLCDLADPESEIVLNEHASWCWVSCADLSGLDWLEADLEVVEQVRRLICG